MRILFQGDSITDAGRARDNDFNPGFGYPDFIKGILGVRYPGKYECFNRGISGNRVVDLYGRTEVDFISLKPDLISILIGINDVWHKLSHNNGVPAPKFETVYDLLLTELEQEIPGVRLVVMEPFVLPGAATNPTEEMPDRLEYFMRETALRAEASRRVAEKHKATFVPLQGVLDEACKTAPATWWLRDGVHPTSQGHMLISNEWLKQVGL